MTHDQIKNMSISEFDKYIEKLIKASMIRCEKLKELKECEYTITKIKRLL